uniref:Uncharacterized protein n=1 Tax=Romanomermis culicivorax TaxID=13658 RepID=A0A915IKX7_ROMCU
MQALSVVHGFFRIIFLSEESQYACGFVVLLMTVYWISECMPLAVTSFLPIFLFPVLKVLKVDDTCRCYLKYVDCLCVPNCRPKK